jgi:hypothetical protein
VTDVTQVTIRALVAFQENRRIHPINAGADQNQGERTHGADASVTLASHHNRARRKHPLDSEGRRALNPQRRSPRYRRPRCTTSLAPPSNSRSCAHLNSHITHARTIDCPIARTASASGRQECEPGLGEIAEAGYLLCSRPSAGRAPAGQRPKERSTGRNQQLWQA